MSNFLQASRDSQAQSSLDWIYQLADIFPYKASSQSPQSASALASDYTISVVSALENSKWMRRCFATSCCK